LLASWLEHIYVCDDDPRDIVPYYFGGSSFQILFHTQLISFAISVVVAASTSISISAYTQIARHSSKSSDGFSQLQSKALQSKAKQSKAKHHPSLEAFNSP